MIVLGLDPSITNFGWAIYDSGAPASSRCVNRGRFGAKRSSFTDEVSRYLHLRESLSLVLSNNSKVTSVGIESPIYGASYSEGLFALFIQNMTCLKLHAKDVVLLGNSQVKKHARLVLGRPKNWKMEKPDMIEAAKLDCGGGRWSSDEADAYLVAKMASRFWEYYVGDLDPEDLTSYERETFHDIRFITRGPRKGKVFRKGHIHKPNKLFFTWSVKG